MEVKQSEKKEIGRIELSDTRDLVATLVEGEKLDLRVYVKSKSHTGWTKQGLRIYLFEGIWEEFKKLIEKVDKEFDELA